MEELNSSQARSFRRAESQAAVQLRASGVRGTFNPDDQLPSTKMPLPSLKKSHASVIEVNQRKFLMTRNNTSHFGRKPSYKSVQKEQATGQGSAN